jgi:hypothetical protein
MNDGSRSLVVPAAVLGACLVLGLLLGGAVLGSQIKAMKLGDRYVTVKGLVERTVKSDSALWPLTFKEAGNDLPLVFAKSETDKAAIVKFFVDQGFSPNDLTAGQIAVTDRLTNEYNNNSEHGSRYIVQQTLTLHSSDVDRVAVASGKTADLVKAGVVLNNGGGVIYRFTGLNVLKPDMITEATRNARASADRFAADSGSRVGSIRSANQGVFSITAADGLMAPTVNDEVGGGGDTSGGESIMKKVRVVSTIDYYLNQ